MTQPLTQAPPTLYENDYHLWVEETVKHLKAGEFQAIDWENLIEEIADLSKRQRDKLNSLVTRLWEHLLKLAYWQTERAYNAAKWKSEIINFRLQINDLIADSPSLKPLLSQIHEKTYHNARKKIIVLTELPPTLFPQTAIATLEQLLDENWLPIESIRS